MKWRFLTLFFMGIMYSPSNSFSQHRDIQFADFVIGSSFKDISDKLYQNKAYLKEGLETVYSFSVPIYDLLDIYDTNQTPSVDKQRMRIYYDDEVFFDLKDIQFKKPKYQFFYKDPYYIMKFNTIESYEVAYASRVNPLLKNLWMKFFNKTLYAIEYTVELSPESFIRLQNNYYKRYQRILTSGDQVIKSDNMILIINVDKYTVNITKVDMKYVDKIQKYINIELEDLIGEMYNYIGKTLNETKFAKLIILEQKKATLKKSLLEKYSAIDAL